MPRAPVIIVSTGCYARLKDTYIIQEDDAGRRVYGPRERDASLPERVSKCSSKCSYEIPFDHRYSTCKHLSSE